MPLACGSQRQVEIDVQTSVLFLTRPASVDIHSRTTEWAGRLTQRVWVLLALLRTSHRPTRTVLLLTCGALSAQNEEHRVRNIVLVHGAWVDGSGWKGVYDILVKEAT